MPTMNVKLLWVPEVNNYTIESIESSQKRNVIPLKTAKKYKYIPKLIQAVFEERKAFIGSMKCLATLPDNHAPSQRTVYYGSFATR